MVNKPLAISGPLKRIVLGLEYDGSVFSGWQKQASPAQNTIQENLEHALSQVADERISTVCAGRTDSGVHATCQV
ncbi:MAG: tRNA pseudouridine(38-40) synthase TruA, partial [Gammaproteobacteria bacterium]|nr:tRNA pseudouridine(38-40) synthase TruA [Gammaproteobacteria bacterium]